MRYSPNGCEITKLGNKQCEIRSKDGGDGTLTYWIRKAETNKEIYGTLCETPNKSLHCKCNYDRQVCTSTGGTHNYGKDE